MATINKIKIGTTEYDIVGSSFYGTCATAGNTSEKIITLNDNKFTLYTGAHITIKFNNANTASNPTLNVDGTTAKEIYYNNAPISTNLLQANEFY